MKKVQKEAAGVRERAVGLQQSRLVAPSMLPLGHSGWSFPMTRMNLHGAQVKRSAHERGSHGSHVLASAPETFFTV